MYAVRNNESPKSLYKRAERVIKQCSNLYTVNSLLFGLMTLAPGLALANPTDGAVVGGSATITSTPAELQIHQTSDRALIEWSSFNIGAGETTHFYQPG